MNLFSAQTLTPVTAPQYCLGEGTRFFARLGTYKALIAFSVLMLLSLPVRLVDLEAPFTGEHEFRQTQTALSVWEIREHGFSLLHPRLPLFGPPWECPFEYPVFQIAAAAVDSIAPWSNLDVSIRLTNLLFFYLTAIALTWLARLLFDWQTALFTGGMFLFSPYNVFWSRTSMIEYAATFFGLAYLILFIRWTFKPGRTLFIFTLCLGVLGCLTKSTSFVIPLVVTGTIAGLLGLRLIRPKFSRPAEAQVLPGALNPAPSAKDSVFLGRDQIPALITLLIVPLFVGYLYAHYSDLIKEQAPFTAWLSSRHPYTKNWMYGTLVQRLQPHNWQRLFNRMQYTVMPNFAGAMVIGLFALPVRLRRFAEVPGGNFWTGCSLALAPFIGILLFYNLYVVHTYYLIACAPFLALFAGVGLALVFTLLRTRFVRAVFVLLLIGLGLHEWSGRIGEMVGAPKTVDPRVSCLSEAAHFINPNEPVIIVSATEWSAFAPYYLKRRAFMALLENKPVDIQPLLDQDYFKKCGFHWLLLEGNDSRISELAARIKSRWKVARSMPIRAGRLSYELYWMSDDQADPRFQ
jgi:hypothetical protein